MLENSQVIYNDKDNPWEDDDIIDIDDERFNFYEGCEEE